MTKNKKEKRIPFDPETESIYCSRCGSKLDASSHMFSEFMLCPKHGEFTIAPVVVRESLWELGPGPGFKMIRSNSPDAGKWFIETDVTTASMWETCQFVDARHSDDSDYDPRETRVL